MSKSSLPRFLMLALFSSAAWAQGIQNHDMFIAGGAAWNGSQTISGTGVTLSSSAGFNFQTDYGYQFARVSAVSLLIDLSFNFVFPGSWKFNPPLMPVSSNNSGDSSWDDGTLGVRAIIPVNVRLSFYGLSGAGIGAFSYPVVTAGANPTYSSNDTVHGVFVFGGGADLRLSRHWSLRMDLRDLVTGRDLSGPGRNHLLPSLGVAIHF